jgi:hypothetical protein
MAFLLHSSAAQHGEQQNAEQQYNKNRNQKYQVEHRRLLLY